MEDTQNISECSHKANIGNLRLQKTIPENWMHMSIMFNGFEFYYVKKSESNVSLLFQVSIA